MKTRNRKIYVTSDNEEFDDELDALIHETELEQKKLIDLFIQNKSDTADEPLSQVSMTRIQNVILDWETWKAARNHALTDANVSELDKKAG